MIALSGEDAGARDRAAVLPRDRVGVGEEAQAGEPDERPGHVAAVRGHAEHDVRHALVEQPGHLGDEVRRDDLVRGGRVGHRDHPREVRRRAPAAAVRGSASTTRPTARPARGLGEGPGERRDLGRELGQGAVRDLGDGEDRGRHQMILRSARKSAISRAASAAGAWMTRPAARAGGGSAFRTLVAQPPRRGEVRAEVAERAARDLARAGGHDPLQRGVARRAEGLGAGDDRGHRGLDQVVALGGQPADADACRRPGPARSRPRRTAAGRPRRAATPAATAPAMPSDVSMPASSRSNGSAFGRLGQHPDRGRQVGALERRVRDVDAARRAHRQGLAHRLRGVPRGHRQHDDLAAVRLDELERRLERVLVVAVDDGGRGGAVEPQVRAQALRAGGGIGDRLGQDDDVHVGSAPVGPWALGGRLSSSRGATGRRSAAGSAGFPRRAG